MNIDWSKAPEGATHWDKWASIFCDDSGFWDKWSEYRKVTHYEWGTERYLPRPTAPTWNGEGLPPVGTVCELQDATEVRILAHTKRAGAPVAVYQCTDSESIEAYTASFFRPIRTPEQIAAEEREKAVKEMVYESCGCEPDGVSTSVFIICEALYEAGYRKVDS